MSKISKHKQRLQISLEELKILQPKMKGIGIGAKSVTIYFDDGSMKENSDFSLVTRTREVLDNIAQITKNMPLNILEDELALFFHPHDPKSF